MNFSGSYHQNDVIFLLKKIQMESTNLEEKEKNIQTGNAHYSEMITYEKAPNKEYMDIFYETLDMNGEKFAKHINILANKIIFDYQDNKEIILVSLARAGTPIGVLLKRIIQNKTQKTIKHYCVSIIRDKGLDENAIKYILKLHNGKDIVFLDGWTGKGVIGKELKSSIDIINNNLNENISSNLYVVADISGTAYWSATHEDYLLPSAILNSTVSGLVSRTILNNKYVGTEDFHACLYYENLLESDISKWFIDKIIYLVNKLPKNDFNNEFIDKTLINKKNKETIDFFMNMYQFNNKNFIKPGVGESTRVLLRRVPKEIWVKNKNDISLKHLFFLAKQKNIPIQENTNLNYNSIAIIEAID